MKKQILALLMACMFLLCTLPVYAEGASLDVHVSAERKEAAVGETVHYTVIAKGQNVIALQFDVLVPDGMRYTSDSGATPPGLNASLGVAAAGWTEQTMRFSFYNDQAVQIPEGTVLLTFDCVVTAEGSHEVSLIGMSAYDSDFAGFQADMQYDTVIVGEVNGGGETQNQPVPPENETQAPDLEDPDSVVPTDGAGDSVGEDTDTPINGDEQDTTGTTVGSGGDPDTGSPDVPSGNAGVTTPSEEIGGSVEGSEGSSAGTDSGTGNTGSSSGHDEGSAGEDTAVSNGDPDATLPDDSIPPSNSDPSGTTASKPEEDSSSQGTEPSDEIVVQQPGQDTTVSAEDPLGQQPEGETVPQESEGEMTQDDQISESTTEGTENTSDSKENETETAPSTPKDSAQEEETRLSWLWPILAVVGALAIATVIILIMKKKQ